MRTPNRTFVFDTQAVLSRKHTRYSLTIGHPWYESPIFDALAAEYFASDA